MRLKQTSAGFRLVRKGGRLRIIAAKVNDIGIRSPGKKPLMRKINPKKAALFREKLSSKNQVAFDEIVRIINSQSQIALADLSASIASRLRKSTNTYYSPSDVYTIILSAKKAKVILQANA